MPPLGCGLSASRLPHHTNICKPPYSYCWEIFGQSYLPLLYTCTTFTESCSCNYWSEHSLRESDCALLRFWKYTYLISVMPGRSCEFQLAQSPELQIKNSAWMRRTQLLLSLYWGVAKSSSYTPGRIGSVSSGLKRLIVSKIRF